MVELVKTSTLVSRRSWVRTPINFFLIRARESTEHTVLTKFTSGRARNPQFQNERDTLDTIEKMCKRPG